MKKFFHYILMAAFLGGTIPFSSCNDDDENQLNEWNTTYISLLPEDYLKPLVTDFNLTSNPQLSSSASFLRLNVLSSLN